MEWVHLLENKLSSFEISFATVPSLFFITKVTFAEFVGQMAVASNN